MDEYSRKNLLDQFELLFIKYRELFLELKIKMENEELDDEQLLIAISHARRCQDAIKKVLAEKEKENDRA